MFSKLRNLGRSSSDMLLSAGITSERQLRELGAVAAYVRVRQAGCAPSLNLLWALEGALTDRDWKAVARDERTSLLLRLDDFQRNEA